MIVSLHVKGSGLVSQPGKGILHVSLFRVFRGFSECRDRCDCYGRYKPYNDGFTRHSQSNRSGMAYKVG